MLCLKKGCKNVRKFRIKCCAYFLYLVKIWHFFYLIRMIKGNLLNLSTLFMKKEVFFYKWNTIKRHLQQIGDPIYKCQQEKDGKKFFLNREVIASYKNAKYVNLLFTRWKIMVAKLILFGWNNKISIIFTDVSETIYINRYLKVFCKVILDKS